MHFYFCCCYLYCCRLTSFLFLFFFSSQLGAEDQYSIKARLVDSISYEMSFHDSAGVIYGSSLTAESSWKSNNASYEITLPFLFPFAGNFHEKIYVNSNGGISFYPWVAANNQNITSSGFIVSGTGAQHSNSPTSLYSRAAVMPYWDDLDVSQGGVISHGAFSGDGGYYVVQWNDVPRYADTVSRANLNVVLYRDGRIKFNYQNSSLRGENVCVAWFLWWCTRYEWRTYYRPALGASATIGIQQIQNGSYTGSYNTKAQNIRFAYNSERLSVGTHQILFTPAADEIRPDFSVSKSVKVLYDPVRGTDNPKAIPGAIIEHAFVIANSGLGASDEDSISISDQSSNNMNFVAGGISSQQGNTPSGVSREAAVLGSDQISIPLSGTFKGLMNLSTAELRVLVSAAAQGQAAAWMPQIEVAYQVTLTE